MTKFIPHARATFRIANMSHYIFCNNEYYNNERLGAQNDIKIMDPFHVPYMYHRFQRHSIFLEMDELLMNEVLSV